MFKQTLDFIQMVGASNRTAQAFKNGGRPSAADLKRLGISETSIDRLGL